MKKNGFVTLVKTMVLIILFTGLAKAASQEPGPQVATKTLTCDDCLKSVFASDKLTEVVLIKLFKKGERLELTATDEELTKIGLPIFQKSVAAHDLCLVKLIVGPGNPGPANAPSTSKGIGIEVWLPSPENWNGRIHALGGGGFQGGAAGLPDQIASPFAAGVADTEGAVSSTTDTGHASVPKTFGIPESGGDFAMNPDGSINEILWRDFSVRAIHEQAVKTKALTVAYYGKPARYSYWEGSSTGGRQGYKLAQAHPEDFDGIIANLPALHWTRLTTAMVYPHLVFQRDLGGKPLTEAQLDLVSNAAINACDMVGGQHLGYIMEPSQCRYDPANDPEVLCVSDGGRSTTTACLTKVQAQAVNKIWYGITADGSVPSPSLDNGWNMPPQGKHLWYGPARGTSLWNVFFTRLLGRPSGVASPEGPPFLGTHQLALEMQDPTLAGPDFRNAKGNGQDGWRALSYAQLAEAFQRGVALNTQFGEINTDNPDLFAFEARGGKLLAWHGTNDEVIPVQGTMQYYDSVVDKMGSLERVQSFYRLYIVPGAGHESPNGTANPQANPPIFTRTQLYKMLVNWVENGVAPGRVELQSPSETPVRRSQPICPYPEKATYIGGDPNVAASFKCKKCDR